MKNKFLKPAFFYACLFISIQTWAQTRFVQPGDIQAVTDYYNARSHASMYNTVTGDNEINPGESSGGDPDYEGAINSGIDGLNSLLRVAHDARGLYDALPSLSAGACAPDFSTNAQAIIPSSCPDANCSSCYTSASNELNFVRMQLGRLWCIYTNTKNFNTAALAFGDNTSGIHAVTGLSWQSARAEIVATYNHFKQTYDSKYVDLIASLQRALMQISACENEYGEPDWYQRFGFIYYEFMKERYKRID